MSDAPLPYDDAAAPPPPVPPPRERHPLGLPAGSIRAVLIIMVMGTVWTLLLIPKPVPLYLYYLLFLMTGVYFAARSSAPTDTDEPSPLYLPRGTIRILLVLGFIGVLSYAIAKDPATFFERPLLSETDQKQTLLLPVVMISTFILGVIVSSVSRKIWAGPQGLPAWYQDVKAWMSVIAVLLLGGKVILELVVFPTMQDPPELPEVQLILSGVIAFYFGARV